MNDSHVSVVSISTVLACQAYILFYSRVLPTPKPEDTSVPAATVVAPAVPAISAVAPVANTLTAAALAQQPAVLVRTPALPLQQGTATTVVVPAVSSAQLDLPASRQRSDSIYSTMSVEEIEAASEEMIDCLFQDAAESASEAGSEEEERESRLEQRGGFKFYAPYRFAVFPCCFCFLLIDCESSKYAVSAKVINNSLLDLIFLFV